MYLGVVILNTVKVYLSYNYFSVKNTLQVNPAQTAPCLDHTTIILPTSEVVLDVFFFLLKCLWLCGHPCLDVLK